MWKLVNRVLYTCEASGSVTGKLSHRLGSQSRALPNAKRATSTVPAGGLARTVGAPAASAVENQPVTAHFEPPHTGPSTVAFRSRSDTVATGHAPNVLRHTHAQCTCQWHVPKATANE